MVFVLKYWRQIALLLFVLFGYVGCMGYGAYQYQAGDTAATARISAELAKAEQKKREQAAQASADYQDDKAERETLERVQYVEIEKIVEKPVYRNVCIEPDGLRELNRAVKGR